MALGDYFCSPLGAMDPEGACEYAVDGYMYVNRTSNLRHNLISMQQGCFLRDCAWSQAELWSTDTTRAAHYASGCLSHGAWTKRLSRLLQVATIPLRSGALSCTFSGADAVGGWDFGASVGRVRAGRSDGEKSA